MSEVAIIKQISGLTEVSDELVSFYLESSTEFIKSYCNLNTIPVGLKNLNLRIAALMLKANTDGNSAAIGGGVKSVTGMSDDKQSISYGTSGKHFTSEEDFVAAFGATLDRYKQMAIEKPVPPRPLPYPFRPYPTIKRRH